MVAVGALLSVQHPVNARLADSIGGVPSALTNFVVGTLVLAAAVALVGVGRPAPGRGEGASRSAWPAACWVVDGARLAEHGGRDRRRSGGRRDRDGTASRLDRARPRRVSTECKPVGAARIAGAALLGTFLIVG